MDAHHRMETGSGPSGERGGRTGGDAEPFPKRRSKAIGSTLEQDSLGDLPYVNVEV